MEYFSTTLEQVAREAAALGMSHALTHALLERGNTPARIQTMSPENRFDEYCQWHGLLGWASNLLSAARAAGVVMNPQLDPEYVRLEDMDEDSVRRAC